MVASSIYLKKNIEKINIIHVLKVGEWLSKIGYFSSKEGDAGSWRNLWETAAG